MWEVSGRRRWSRTKSTVVDLSSVRRKFGNVGESMTSYTVDVGDCGEGGGLGLCDLERPKSKPRVFAALALMEMGGGFGVEKRIEEVVELCDDEGRYSN